jgi:hypothetical protein
MPSRNGMLASAATAPSRASSSPLSTSTSTPTRVRRASRSWRELRASRTAAAVAIASTRGRCGRETDVRKRLTARTVVVTDPRGKVVGRPPPSRVCTRSSRSTRKPRPGDDRGERESRGVRAEIDDGEQLGHGR